MGYAVVIAMLVCALAAVLAAFAIEREETGGTLEARSPATAQEG